MGDNREIVNLISSSLDAGNYKEALNALSDDKYKETFTDWCWQITGTVVRKIQDDTIVIKPSLYGTCEQMLSFIMEKCSHDDALLEFIELLEMAKNDAQLGIVLPLIQKLLQKMTTNKKRSLEWCLYALSNYIEKIQITEHHLEGDERKLIDSDPNIRRVTKVYTMILPFYQPFIDEILAAKAHSNTLTLQMKHIISEFLITLLGKPMIYIDIDSNANARSEARQACATIIKDLCELEKDLLKFLNQLEKKEKLRIRYSDGSDKPSAFENSDRMNMTTYAGLFYIACSGHFEIPDWALPQVYSSQHVIHRLMLAVNHLLRYTEYGPLTKALALYQALNNRLANHTSHEMLSSSVHYDMCKRLINVAIYCSYESVRKTALNAIGDHINKFDYKGRCQLIKYLIGVSNHSGMIGYAITMYKNALTESFNEPELNECFIGAQLGGMIKLICYLPHGAESDLMELADQIITALNFLRYLVLKDKDNASGIRDLIPTIETEYLDVLVTALKMSKAHYELKLKDVLDGTDQPGVTLSVAGNVLDSIPPEKKKEIIESALNAFHLMESLLARLTECMKPAVVEVEESAQP